MAVKWRWAPQAARERMAAERAAAEHERDSVKEQLSLALSQTRALELACQEWVVEVQREARVRAEAPLFVLIQSAQTPIQLTPSPPRARRFRTGQGG